jgi:hypothetical protein
MSSARELYVISSFTHHSLLFTDYIYIMDVNVGRREREREKGRDKERENERKGGR